jgi:hypothetical protein
MYTFAGLVPIVLQVALANETVMVIGSVTAKVDGVMVTCARPMAVKKQKTSRNKVDIFIGTKLKWVRHA